VEADKVDMPVAGEAVIDVIPICEAGENRARVFGEGVKIKAVVDEEGCLEGLDVVTGVFVRAYEECAKRNECYEHFGGFCFKLNLTSCDGLRVIPSPS
jgi:hypothetical protein